MRTYLTTKEVVKLAKEFEITKGMVLGDIQRGKLAVANRNSAKSRNLFLEETVKIYLQNKKERKNKIKERKEKKTKNKGKNLHSRNKQEIKNTRLFVRLNDRQKEKINKLIELSGENNISEFIRHLIDKAEIDLQK